jgi:hypothetical protein
MRQAHNGKPYRAVVRPLLRCYPAGMTTTHKFQRSLRGAALVLLLAGIGLWVGTGARVGWTQTSTVRIEHDEITGIDYPVRQPAFIAGVEVPLLGSGAAAMLAALSLLPGRRPLLARR